MNTLHIKKGDNVEVISGRCKGQRGKVVATAPSEGKVMVEGVNMVSKHLKPRGQHQQGGIIKTEGALYACKVQAVCPKCDKAVRTGVKVVDGKKVRYCKKCQKEF